MGTVGTPAPAGASGASSAASLVVSDVAKTFASGPALRGVSLDVRDGEIHGLVGGNGSGKSTLVKILAGVYQGDSGPGELRAGEATIHASKVTPEWSRAVGLRFVHQEPDVIEALSVAENLAIGQGFPKRAGTAIRWRALRRDAQQLLDRFEIDVRPRDLVADLSPAQKTMVAIARAFRGQHAESGPPLVLDEPTAALPAREADELLATLRRFAGAGRGILFVSHRLAEVIATSDRITVLRDGRVAGELQAEGLTEERLVETMVGRTLSPMTHIAALPEGAAQAQDAGRTVVLEARGLVGGPLDGVSLRLHRGEILGIAGLRGSGRSKLLMSLFGAHRLAAGEILVEGRPLRSHDVHHALKAGIAFVPEERAAHAAFAAMSVRENLSAGNVGEYFRGGWLRHGAERRDAERLIGEFLIKASSDSEPLYTLSGGNQQKVILARWLGRRPKILLLDEPTQGVDVAARAQIYALLDRAVTGGTSIVLVSSEFEELTRLADRVLVLNGGRIAAEVGAPDLDPDHLAALSMGPATAATTQ